MKLYHNRLLYNTLTHPEVWQKGKEESLTNYQYPFNEHVIVLLNQLRSTEHKPAKELHGCLSDTGGVVHEATMNPTLHIQLKNKEGRLVKHRLTLLKVMACTAANTGWFTRARILGSTATTSDRHFMALVLTAMALSPSTLRIYTRDVKNVSGSQHNIFSH